MHRHNPYGCLVVEFVDLAFDFVENPAIHDEFADELADITGIPAEGFLDSPRLFFDLACAKLVLECYPLMAHEPSIRLAEYDTFEREYLTNASVGLFLQRYEEYLATPDFRVFDGAGLRDEDRCHFPAHQIELFRNYVEERGIHELMRIILGRVARQAQVDLEIDTDLCLMAGVLLVGTHFTNFWRTALYVSHNPEVLYAEPAEPRSESSEQLLSRLFPRIHV